MKVMSSDVNMALTWMAKFSNTEQLSVGPQGMRFATLLLDVLFPDLVLACKNGGRKMQIGCESKLYFYAV